MFDYVPSSPWTGLWVRQDWLEALNIEIPQTIEDWDVMLRALKENYGAVLGFNIRDQNNWYGTATNFNFSAAYETGYNWINRDGVAEYGPANAGYKDFLTQMNKWYADGLIDADFPTRTNDDYFANVANGVYGAFGLAYGELGQAKVSGLAKDPAFKLLAVRQPTSYEGQTIKLRQFDSIVRTDKDFVTTKVVDDGIADIVMQWKDWWYSQEGGDLCSYGPLGKSYEWNDQDELVWTYETSGLVQKGDDLDFWTVYPLFKLHNWGYLRDSTAYENQPEVWQCISEWEKDDASYYMSDAISPTADEAKELSRIETNLKTYREEMTHKYITGQESLDTFDAYIESLESMDLATAIEIKQAGLDRYLER
jgi:putative aldouronate transport system substrate-binding protein